jgi:D-alanyl-D-alanine carboxypeptidase
MTTATLQPPYREATPAELKVVGQYRDTGRQVQMRSDAAAALANLLTQANAEGVRIIPISGFRTIEYQAGLFQKAIVKYGSEAGAGGWVARPGYSEHHTGLAVDLGAEEFPACDCATPFEETPAFHWLCEHAARFGFELSFPRNNTRGINYEPWHWRFIGTPSAREVFEQ